MKLVEHHFLDFEFRPGPDRNVLVCCCIKSFDAQSLEKKRQFWLLDPEGPQSLVAFLNSCKGHTFVAFAAQAEISCFFDLGLNPLEFNWVCLFNWGKPWFYSSYKFFKHFETKKEKEGEFLPVIPDKFSSSIDNRHKLKSCCNLVSFLDFFCNIQRDLEEKKDMINLILSNLEYTQQQKNSILDYCWEDVEDLPILLESLRNNPYKFHFLNSRTLVHWTKIQRTGIPLNRELLDRLVLQIPDIKSGIYDNVNKECLSKGLPIIFECVNGDFHEKKSNVVELIKILGLSDNWPKTEKGVYKTDRDTTRAFASFEIIKTWREAKQLLSDLRMLTPDKDVIGKKTFWTYISKTMYGYRQHPWYNPFGSISSRFQPSAVSFIYAQPSWMRIFIKPDPGKSIVSVDFAAQEIWIAGILSRDLNLLSDYESGDIYLTFGKKISFVPMDATSKTHSKERDLCKGVVLGLQYGMGVNKLSESLNITQEKALFLVNEHKKRYWRFWSWKRNYLSNHERVGCTFLSDESWMLLDNKAHKTTEKWKDGDHYSLTTGNFPIQGMGAVILRKIVDMMILEWSVISTVHDEINIELEAYRVLDFYNYFNELMTDFCKSCPTPLRFDFSVQKQDDYLIKPKGKAALFRLSPYLGIEF